MKYITYILIAGMLFLIMSCSGTKVKSQKDITQAETHYNLGKTYHDQGKLNDAIREYQTAIRINPDYVEAHNNLGNLYSDQDKMDDAVREYQTAIRIKPDYARAHNNLRKIYTTNKGLMDDSIIAEFQTLIQNHPKCVELYLTFAKLQEIKGNYAKAIQALKEAQHVAPHSEKVKNALLKLEGRNSEE